MSCCGDCCDCCSHCDYVCDEHLVFLGPKEAPQYGPKTFHAQVTLTMLADMMKRLYSTPYEASPKFGGLVEWAKVQK